MKETTKVKILETVQNLAESEGISFGEVIAVLLQGQLSWSKFEARYRNPVRDKEYLDFIRGFGCVQCGRPSQAHHEGPRGMGQKTDDYRTIPLCPECHTKHHMGNLDLEEVPTLMLEYLISFTRMVRNK